MVQNLQIQFVTFSLIKELWRNSITLKTASNCNTMKDLIETIVKPLVDFPDDVHVTVHEEDIV